MIIFCIECSHSRGMGHLFRSIYLASLLRMRGSQISFIINDYIVSKQMLRNFGFEFEIADLSNFDSLWELDVISRKKARIWVNDRLDTDGRHGSVISKANIPLITFDDLGGGAMYADLHVAALIINSQHLSGKKILCGFDYLILNPELKKYQRLRDSQNKILVTLGGSDTWGVTSKVVSELSRLNLGGTVILGPGFSHQLNLDKLLTNKFKVLSSVKSLAKEMNNYEIAITGGGITPFEACASGLPCVVIANEEFEVDIGIGLQELGCAVYAGHHTNFSLEILSNTLPISRMSKTGISKIGLHGISRVANEIEKFLPNE